MKSQDGHCNRREVSVPVYVQVFPGNIMVTEPENVTCSWKRRSVLFHSSTTRQFHRFPNNRLARGRSVFRPHLCVSLKKRARASGNPYAEHIQSTGEAGK